MQTNKTVIEKLITEEENTIFFIEQGEVQVINFLSFLWDIEQGNIKGFEGLSSHKLFVVNQCHRWSY